MANPPQIPNYSAEISVPLHATVMRKLYVSCQEYASQGKTVKARAITILFLLAVPCTTVKYAIQAPLCTLWDFIRLRNGFNSLGTKIAEATHCLSFGLLQTSYLWANCNSHIVRVQERRALVHANTRRVTELETRIRDLEQRPQSGNATEPVIPNPEAEELRQLKSRFEEETGRLRDQIAALQQEHAKKLEEVKRFHQERLSEIADASLAQIEDEKKKAAPPLSSLPVQINLVPQATLATSTEPMEVEEEEPLDANTNFILSLIKKSNYFFSTPADWIDYYCFDGDAPWKTHRYSLSAKHYAAFEEFHKELTNQFRNHYLDEVKEIVLLFDKAYTALKDMRDKNTDPRTYHKQFVRLLRPAQDKFVRSIGHLPREFAEFVFKNMDKRFSGSRLNSFYSKLTFWMAREGQNEARSLIGMSLTEKLKWVHEGIEKANAKLKSPFMHIWGKKVEPLMTGFDPNGDVSHPSIMGVAQYRNAANGKIKEVTLMRTAVPVCGRSSPENEEPQYFELGDTALSPEYLAHCHSLRTQGKKMMVILHLDPRNLKYFDQTAKSPLVNCGKFKVASLKTREAQWIQLFRQLGQKYPDHFKVCVFPLDGQWMHDLNLEKAMGINAFIGSLQKVFKASNSPLKLPSFVNKSPDTADDHILIDKVLDEVWTTYFKDKLSLNADERRAFLTLFYSRLAEHLRFKYDIDFEQRNCKDAVDRTEAIAGVHAAEAVNRLGRLRDPKTQDILIGKTEGPALAYTKRGVLHDREIFVESGFRHLETIPGVKPPAINGFELVNFDLCEDPSQSVLPLPSQAKDRNAYNAHLLQLADTPAVLPIEIPLPAKRAEGLSLQRNVLVDGQEKDLMVAIRELGLDREVLKPYFYATDLFREPQEQLEQLFENRDLNARVISKEPIHAFVTLNGQLTLQITRDTPLSETHKAVTTINVDLTTYRAHYKIELKKDPPSRTGSPGRPGSPMEVVPTN